MKNNIYYLIVGLLVSLFFTQCGDEGYEKIDLSIGYKAYFVQDEKDAAPAYLLYVIVDSFATTSQKEKIDITNIKLEKNHDATFMKNLMGDHILWRSSTHHKEITDFNDKYEITATTKKDGNILRNTFYIKNDTVAIMTALNIREFIYEDGYIKGTVYKVKKAQKYGFILTSKISNDRKRNKYCEATTTMFLENNERDTLYNLSYYYSKVEPDTARPIYVRIYANTSEGVYLESQDIKTLSNNEDGSKREKFDTDL